LQAHDAQVAGHGDLLVDAHLGRVMKRWDDIEAGFYEQTKDSSLAAFMPRFFGIANHDAEGKRIRFIELEDLTRGVRQACVMDVKLGFITHLATMSAKKIEECIEKARTSTQSTDGMRICGIKLTDAHTGEVHSTDKEWGKRIVSANLEDAFRWFLGGDKVHEPTVQVYLQRLESLQREVSTNYRLWRFVSSSLLFVHAADGSSADVRMIDFAHAIPPAADLVQAEAEAAEVGYLAGLANVISLLKRIAAHPHRHINKEICVGRQHKHAGVHHHAPPHGSS
jgi:endonuclease III